MPRPGSRLLLLCGDAGCTIGDRAGLAALVGCLVTYDDTTTISVVGDPARTALLPGITQIVARGPRALPALLAAAKRADRVLVAGGERFQDDDSRTNMHYWAARIALLRTFNARISALAIGAGPLSHPDTRLAARIACRSLTRVSVRDRFARDALAACTTRKIEIVPDSAFMLEAAPRDAAIALVKRSGLPADRPLVVVTLRRWFHQRGGFLPTGLKTRLGIESKRDHERFEAMQGVVASALETLARRLDAGILLLPGCNVGQEADDAACEALMWRMLRSTVRMARVEDPRLYKAVIGLASLVVSARMIPLVFAAGMGVPFVGLSYNPKFDGLYDLLGLSSRSLPLDQCAGAWGASTLLAAADAALQARIDLHPRAAALAHASRQASLDVAFGALPDEVMETVDA